MQVRLSCQDKTLLQMGLESEEIVEALYRTGWKGKEEGITQFKIKKAVHEITFGTRLQSCPSNGRLCYESYKSNKKKSNQIKEWMMSSESGRQNKSVQTRQQRKDIQT